MAPEIKQPINQIGLSNLFFKKNPIIPNNKIDPRIVDEMLIAFCRFLLNLFIGSV